VHAYWSAILTASLVLSSEAYAGTPIYLPLQVSNKWTYVGQSGDIEVLTTTGTIALRGNEVFVIRYGPSIQNEGLENYWTVGPDGDVLLWGAYRPVENWGVLYEPPLPMADAPLALGKTWGQSTHVYFLPDTTDGGTIEFGFQVYEAGPLMVPAGTFEAYGVGQTVPTPLPIGLGSYALTGELLNGSLGGSLAADWWCDGVGNVQWGTSELFRLSSYSLTTSARPVTWGELKARYRTRAR
jgi:hypothetical protein